MHVASNQSIGLLGMLTPADMMASSRQHLMQIMQEDIAEANYLRQSAQNPNISPEAAQQAIQNAIEFEAEAAAIAAWLQLTTNQQANTNGQQFIQNMTQQYIASYNAAENFVQNTNTGDPNNQASTGNGILDVLKTPVVAGIPLWAIAGGIGAWMYLK